MSLINPNDQRWARFHRMRKRRILLALLFCLVLGLSALALLLLSGCAVVADIRNARPMPGNDTPKPHLPWTYQLNARSMSMAPTIRNGDWLTIEPVPFAALKVGDIVVRWKPYLMHKIVRKVAGGFVTAGDNNQREDAGIMYEQAYLGRVKVLKHWPK